jgi:hypothetical protein
MHANHVGNHTHDKAVAADIERWNESLNLNAEPNGMEALHIPTAATA